MITIVITITYVGTIVFVNIWHHWQHQMCNNSSLHKLKETYIISHFCAEQFDDVIWKSKLISLKDAGKYYIKGEILCEEKLEHE